MRLVMTKSELGLYKRSKEETPMKIYWSQDQGSYCTLASKKGKLLCKSKIKDSIIKVKISKVKKTKVLHNNEDISL